MKKHRGPIPEDRDLTAGEVRLVRWLHEHGTGDARAFISQLENLRVVSRCRCGCPSIDFVPDCASGMQILSDYVYDDPAGHTVGVFLFASAGRLAGLEIWSIEGDPVPNAVPAPELLRPLRA